MFWRIWVILLCGLSVPVLHAADSSPELQQQIQQLTKLVQSMQRQLGQIQAEQTELRADAKALRDKVAGQEGQTAVVSAAGPLAYAAEKPGAAAEPELGGDESSFVDLSIREQSSIEEVQDNHVLSNPWWRNFHISGFAGTGLYKTGSSGSKDNGGFAIKEASLFIEGDVWEDIAFFIELQTNRLGKDDEVFTRTGEVYAHFRNLQLADEMAIGIKVGRIDIPFGEEYLWQDAIDNPLITTSAAYAYGADEGFLIYGAYKDLNWIVSVTDGTEARSIDDNSDKSVNLKLYGKPLDSLYLSLSLMRGGDTMFGGLEFGGSHIQPVNDYGGVSALGLSLSSEVDANLGEIDAKYRFDLLSYEAYLSLTAGAITMDDKESFFDRSFAWFAIEPFVSFNRNWYAILRYSEVGTYRDDEGFAFNGKTFATGINDFGFDAKRLQRLAIGLGWTPNPHLRTKLEFGKDWFSLIDASPLSTNNNERFFLGLEVALGF